MNLIYPMSTGEPAVAGIGYLDNRHLRDPAESINGNMGDPADDVKGSRSNGLVTVLKSSKASGGSQRSHSVCLAAHYGLSVPAVTLVNSEPTPRGVTAGSGVARATIFTLT